LTFNNANELNMIKNKTIGWKAIGKYTILCCKNKIFDVNTRRLNFSNHENRSRIIFGFKPGYKVVIDIQ